MIADTPANQAQRLAALKSYAILDTPLEEAYDNLCKLAALICQTPIAVINFIDDHRQWFKAEIGLGVRETPLDPSICAHAILQEELFVVPDTLLDSRFHDNPLCISEPKLRFYAGALLRTEDLHALGTLCVLDVVPRTLNPAQTEALRVLSAQVMQLLEMRRGLQALRTSETFAQSVIENSPDCVKILDLEGRILSMNPAGCRQMQIDNFAACYRSSWLNFWTKDRDLAQVALKLARSGGNGKFRGFSPTVKGDPRWWDVIVAPIRDGEGKVVQILSVSRDVTDQLKLEEHLRTKDKLESLGVLAGGIAHDFNNLLTGILGNASLLQEMVCGPEQELAAEIVSAAEKAAHLTNQMLAYSGKGKFASKQINLSFEVREILPLLRPALTNVKLELRLDEKLPDIKADPGQIHQLVMNLIVNAAEAIEGRSGTVFIATRVVEMAVEMAARSAEGGALSEAPPARSYVCLEVRDTGVGISREAQAKIFDPFFTTKFTGRGLGLAAVSGIVRGHRGSIEVQSVPGVGTTFTVLLPVPTASSDAGFFPRPCASAKLNTGRSAVLALQEDGAESG